MKIKNFRIKAAAVLLLSVPLLLMSGCSGPSGVYASFEEETSFSGETEKETSGTVTEALKTETDNSMTPAGYAYLCGAVVSPGVYPIGEDTRLYELVEMAGGFGEDADEEWLNQAMTVSDGQQIYVYTVSETRQLREQADGNSPTAESFYLDQGAALEQSGASDGAADKEKQKINLNTADKEELMTLSGIGEAKAGAIIQYREEQGSFLTIEEIKQVSGIGESIYNKIKNQITV